jgi:hypothetical protein
VKRFGVVLLLIGAGGGCNAQTWDFSEEGGAPGTDATLPSDASGDAPAEGGSTRRDGGESLGRCITESDCARVGLHCLLTMGSPGTCVPCLNDGDCHEPTLPHCSSALNRCVECDTPAECQPNENCALDPVYSCVPICPNDTVVCPAGASSCINGLCVACKSALDCRHGQVCDSLTGRCVECVSEQDCRIIHPFWHCDRTVSRCVQCLHNSDCGRGACVPPGICVGLDGIPWWDE